MKGLVNSVAYAGGRLLGEVSIPDISEVLKQPDRFVWVGLYEPDDEMLKESQQEFSLHDLAIGINEMIDTLRELLTTAHEANLSLISVSQNEAMKRLAAWAAIIAVPTMIAGVYGMNFKFMPELEWLWGYPVTMIVMVGACGFLYYRFKRAGWL